MKSLLPLFLLFSSTLLLSAQDVSVEGYAFEENNSGYLNEVMIIAELNGQLLPLPQAVYSNMEGKFTLKLPPVPAVVIKGSKSGYETFSLTVNPLSAKPGEPIYVKLPLRRAPGYVLEGTLSDALTPDQVQAMSANPEANAIIGADIEMYNNTTYTPVLALKNHQSYNFSTRLEQGNWYTMLIRKEGYYNKRIEIKVNIQGCILCMEGIGTVTPGVVDNLTAGLTMGTLGANITLQRLEMDKDVNIENIYYDLGQHYIRPDAQPALDNISTLLRNNPTLIIELSSHTDSRGTTADNQALSQRRAEAAVAYIIQKGNIAPQRISAQGYGETRLVNGCSDGVNCTEEQHQQNRRTVFKIIGLTQEAPYAMKSLAQIKFEENQEAILPQMEQSYFEMPAVASGTDSLAAAYPFAETTPATDTPTGQLPIFDEPVVGMVETPIAITEPPVVTGNQDAVDVSLAGTPLYMYSGWKVLLEELINEPTYLEPAFETLGGVEVEIREGRWGLLYGFFATEALAEAWLQEIKVDYPQARTVQYLRGVRQ